MVTAVVKEIFTGQASESREIAMKVILNDEREVDFVLSRDIAIHLIEQIYLSLDTHGLHRPVDLH